MIMTKMQKGKRYLIKYPVSFYPIQGYSIRDAEVLEEASAWVKLKIQGVAEPEWVSSDKYDILEELSS